VILSRVALEHLARSGDLHAGGKGFVSFLFHIKASKV
jgi:hypothetical protein